MQAFIGWINENKEEHKAALESSSLMQMGRNYLKGRWSVIRKIRVVRLLRKLIEEGIMVRGLREIYEEGCRILSEMEKEVYGGGGGEGIGEKEEEEEYMRELYLLKVRGIQMKMKEDEVEVLRKEVEEEKREMEERIRNLEREAYFLKLTPITSLNKTSVMITQNMEGNTITNSSGGYRNYLIGGEMRSVCSSFILFLYHFFLPSFSLYLSIYIYLLICYRESIGCMYHTLYHFIPSL